mmetsp:Transcript_13670/g.31215  ORF Transcript_13670/g.31215 Transcript_13670/m.31215 type:complete len:157 (-) Transcript_13670:367-837(-)
MAMTWQQMKMEEKVLSVASRLRERQGRKGSMALMLKGLASGVAQAVRGRMGVAAPASLAAFGMPSRAFGDAAGLSKDEVTARVLEVVKNMDKVEPGKVTAESCEFTKDLGLDSLDTVEVVMAFEEEFSLEIPDDDADKIASVQGAIEYIAKHPMAK